MTAAVSDELPPEPRARRGRGNRAGLTPARIVEAVRDLDPDTITVQAVADRLGVDRATVHHHISDLGTLRELMALDAFAAGFQPVEIAPDATWREACSALAYSMHDAVIAANGHGAYIELSATDVVLLEPVEHTLRIMMAAGFDDETAARGLATLASFAAAAAREQLIARRSSGHPQVPELLRALDDPRAAGFTNLRRLAEADLVGVDDAQLHTSIDLILDGMAARLTTSPR
ncbi:TetR/AcrR family transcriptional regulator C-terminal domain-containing protein [Herbiconiux sp. YIM B11900]|uniref:TetR/AcrR family transcriptional regulator C-terminal domain-containing protein n=1 Tax=Herbiconiux sp. YIM B11900 TaxID=3404131 RepID=UPI003F82893B